MAWEPRIQKARFYEPLLGEENDKLLICRLSPQDVTATPHEFSEARKYTGLYLGASKSIYASYNTILRRTKPPLRRF
ncbi:hypothetical protein SODG_005382 [Sodalis praecaptivus]